MNKTEMTRNMMNLLEKSTSAFHTVKAYEEELAANGFQKLELRDKWNLERRRKIHCESPWNSSFCVHSW